MSNHTSALSGLDDKVRRTAHLINLLRQRIDGQPAYSLFLGAGASATSGIRTAKQMVAEWRQQSYSRERAPDCYDDWLHRQGWRDAPNEYSLLFEQLYDTPSQRRAYIELASAHAHPSWGYAFLTRLLSTGTFNVVFTTNFDDLISDACWMFGAKNKPLVCAHDSSVVGLRLASSRPKIIKLHGDYLFDSIKNTTSELQSIEDNMRAKFSEYAEHQGLLVVGYAGNDASIMDLLDLLVRNPKNFRDGVYWCLRDGEAPSRRVQQLLRHDRVYLVRIAGFDEFMAEIADAMNIGLPVGVLSPHLLAYESTKHLLEARPSGNNPALVSAFYRVAEKHERAKSVLRKAGLASEVSSSLDEIVGELKNEDVPFHEAKKKLKNGLFADAARDFGALATTEGSSSFSMHCWNKMLECTMRAGDTRAAAEEVRRNVPHKWEDSNHYLMRSFYALLLHESKLAIEYASKSIALNPGLVESHVNRAMAYWMLNRTDKYKEELDLIRSHQGVAKSALGCLHGP
jgi:tetratricopeptide (TPR) repeat protein